MDVAWTCVVYANRTSTFHSTVLDPSWKAKNWAQEGRKGENRGGMGNMRLGKNFCKDLTLMLLEKCECLHA